jgi:hypothetical protein
LAGDTVYGAVRLLKWLVDRPIAPHIPVWDKSARSDGTFSRADFVFDRSRNIYICPKGKLLHTTGAHTLRYRASKRKPISLAQQGQPRPSAARNRPAPRGAW